MFTFNTAETLPPWLLVTALAIWFAAQVYQPSSVAECAASCPGSWVYDGLTCRCEVTP